jgi:2,4-dienoyl-CoA reductase-like NADH-dependent reductase (Old Yellow Enzyme family)
MTSTKLFSPIRIRNLELKNRIVCSPMCQYSAQDGVPNNWHLVHLGSRAVGGTALIIAEATGVSPEGRISDGDLGIWNEEQTKAFKPITEFIKSQNSIPGIQLAHAGRKASTPAPWQKQIDPGKAWTPLAPSAIPFDDNHQTPSEMAEKDLDVVRKQFAEAAKNSLQAGFQVVEIHMAHGYLLNEFLSPLSNHRKDQFGGSLKNRMRFPLSIAEDIRKMWPGDWPVFVRISATDWKEGGWTLDDSVIFCKELKKIGIDVIDCSSGGSAPDAKITAGPGYQVPFSEEIKRRSEILTAAVGIITEAKQAESILQKNQSDLIVMARELLRDPYWPLHAALELNVDVPWPVQYERAKRAKRT